MFFQLLIDSARFRFFIFILVIYLKFVKQVMRNTLRIIKWVAIHSYKNVSLSKAIASACFLHRESHNSGLERRLFRHVFIVSVNRRCTVFSFERYMFGERKQNMEYFVSFRYRIHNQYEKCIPNIYVNSKDYDLNRSEKTWWYFLINFIYL